MYSVRHCSHCFQYFLPTLEWAFFCPNPPKSGVSSVEVKRYSLWLLNNKNVDNMNVSSKFVICLNLVSASTLLLLLSTRFEWF